MEAISITMNKSKNLSMKKRSQGPRPQPKRSMAIQRREGQKRPMSGPAVAPARFSTLANGDIRIVRREYLKAVLSPASTFEVEHSHLNPGKEVFHWLSQVADNYEEYVFEKLSFEYKPVISSATYSGSMGSIVVAVLYNAGAQELDTYAKMVEYSGAIEKRICDPLVMKVNVSKNTHAGEDHYIRTGDVPTGEDIKTYDIGKLLVAVDHVSSSFPSGTLLGHMYADYSVILRKPKLKNVTVEPVAEMPFGNWCTAVSTSGWIESGLKTLSLTNIEATFITDPLNGRKLIFTLPEPGRYYMSFYCTLDASSTIALTLSTGLSYLAISASSGSVAYEQVYDTTTPFENTCTAFIESTLPDTEIAFLPGVADVDITGFNLLVQGIPQGSLSWSS